MPSRETMMLRVPHAPFGSQCWSERYPATVELVREVLADVAGDGGGQTNAVGHPYDEQGGVRRGLEREIEWDTVRRRRSSHA